MRLQTLLYTPEAALAVGLIVFALITVAVRRRAPGVASLASLDGAGPLQRRAGFLRAISRYGAAAILLTFAAIDVVPYLNVFARYFVPAAVPLFGEATDVDWWRYTTPVAMAIVVLLVTLFRIVRENAAPQLPVLSLERRGLLSFTKRRDSVLASLSYALVVLTCVGSGASSVADGDGEYSMMSIPDSLGGGSASFFGWAYGLPVLVGVSVMAIVLVIALRVNSSPPFMSPSSVPGERAARRETSAVMFRLAIATTLLTLGGVWLFVGDVGSAVESAEPTLFMPLFSAIAPITRLAGFAVQVTAVIMLLLMIRRSRHLPTTEKAHLERTTV